MNLDSIQQYLDRMNIVLTRGLNPQVFDVNNFIKDLQAVIEPAIASAVDFDKEALLDFQQSMETLTIEIGNTLAAIQTETDPIAKAELQKDLVVTIPATQAAVKSTLVTKLATSGAAILDAILTFLVSVAIKAGKALLLP